MNGFGADADVRCETVDGQCGPVREHHGAGQDKCTAGTVKFDSTAQSCMKPGSLLEGRFLRQAS